MLHFLLRLDIFLDAPIWAATCTADAILQLLHFLCTVLVLLVGSKSPDNLNVQSPHNAQDEITVAAAKAIRSILVNCCSTCLLIPNPSMHLTIRELMEAALSTDVEEAMAITAEGCTRVTMQLEQGGGTIRQSLGELAGPVLQLCNVALGAIPPPGAAWTEQAFLAVDALGRYLHVIHAIIRFCESTVTRLLSEFCQVLVFPFLAQVMEKVTQSSECILDKVLAIHEQVLKTSPDVVAPNFQQTMKYMVNIFEATYHAASLGYIASAVEIFGASIPIVFRELLEYITTLVFRFFQTVRVDERPDVVAAFFQLAQRYVLYCPDALVQSLQLSSIVACAVECTTACQGERESTRATLNFMSQLFGWRSLRLSTEATSSFQAASHIVDQHRGQHGARILHVCIATLVGGPQMLWPAATDCIFSVSLAALTGQGSIEDDNLVADAGSTTLSLTRHWLETAIPAQDHANIFPQVVTLLLRLIQQGQTSKGKVKMLLTDYSKICKGEMTEDALLTYSL
jgi:hypothetical protein